MSERIIQLDSVGPIRDDRQITLVKFCGPEAMDNFIGSRVCADISIEDVSTGECVTIRLNRLQAEHLGIVLQANFKTD